MISRFTHSRFVILATLAVLLSSVISFSASAEDDSKEKIREDHAFDQLIIGYTDQGTSTEKIAIREKSRRDVSATSYESISPRDSRTEVVKLGKNISVEEAINRLKGQPGIRFVEPDYIVHALAVPTDPFFTSVTTPLWGMRGPLSEPVNQFGSNAASAWAQDYVGNINVAVGVVDEGIQVLHPDLVGNIWSNPRELPADRLDNDGNGYIDDINGWNFVNNNATVYGGGTSDSHGTHVAGTIGAKANNVGVVGVNWNVNIISAKFLGATGGTTSNAIKAIDYLTDLKRRGLANIVAINNSWGGGGFSQALLDAINRAGDQNILFVAAAGNSTANNDVVASYPSNYLCDNSNTRGWDCVIAVASINSAGAKSAFSSFGATTVDLGAPGDGIWSTISGGGYASYSGTSMATPHVTGAAALCESINPALSGKQIRDAILSTAARTPTPSLDTSTVTRGRLNIGLMADVCKNGVSIPLNFAGASNPITLAPGVVGTGYSQKILTLNGTGLNTWSIVSTVSPLILPPGLTLLGGVISGTPTTAGSFTPVIRVTDGLTTIDSQVNITVTSPPPGAFTLTSPANAATRQNVPVTLSWGASTNATEYQYCIATTSGCLPTISTGTNRSVSVSGLTATTRYFWTVRSKNAAGLFTTTSSGYRSFTTR